MNFVLPGVWHRALHCSASLTCYGLNLSRKACLDFTKSFKIQYPKKGMFLFLLSLVCCIPNEECQELLKVDYVNVSGVCEGPVL